MPEQEAPATTGFASPAAAGGSVEVRDEPGRHRFVAELDGTIVGSASYKRAEPTITFTHTVVSGAYEGRGVGGALVRAALDTARDRGLRVVPSCSFVASWIDRHPDYRSLLAQPA